MLTGQCGKRTISVMIGSFQKRAQTYRIQNWRPNRFPLEGVFAANFEFCTSEPDEGRIAVQILLTNDDGIYAPGLAALERELVKLGDVRVVAPATEQSGVGHSITFLMPLVCKEVFEGERRRGWAVEGSPADCVKLGIFEFCLERPDLIVSGINGGLNAGINVLYSGTVAAAIEGAFFGITSISVSLEYDEHAQFDRAARIARRVIEQILEQKGPGPQLYNLNIPTRAFHRPTELRVVPMGIARYGEHFLKRKDPKGRTYYWATSDPPPPKGAGDNDLTALEQGFVTLTPLQYDMTKLATLREMQSWDLSLECDDASSL
jgi:5'-nucleotidase